jgi:hypothetical protein
MIKFRDWCDRTGHKYISWDFIAKGIVAAIVLAVYRNYIAVKLFYGLVYRSINEKF